MFVCFTLKSSAINLIVSKQLVLSYLIYQTNNLFQFNFLYPNVCTTIKINGFMLLPRLERNMLKFQNYYIKHFINLFQEFQYKKVFCTFSLIHLSLRGGIMSLNWSLKLNYPNLFENKKNCFRLSSDPGRRRQLAFPLNYVPKSFKAVGPGIKNCNRILVSEQILIFCETLLLSRYLRQGCKASSDSLVRELLLKGKAQYG